MADTSSVSRATFADSATTLQAALMSLFSGQAADTETDLAKLFTPTFRHYDEDGHKVVDFDGWVKHIRWLREIMKPGDVNLVVTQFVRDGNQLAERHISTSKHPDGTIGRGHTFQFMEIAEDGRIEWIVETVKREVSVKDGELSVEA